MIKVYLLIAHHLNADDWSYRMLPGFPLLTRSFVILCDITRNIIISMRLVHQFCLATSIQDVYRIYIYIYISTWPGQIIYYNNVYGDISGTVPNSTGTHS